MTHGEGGGVGKEAKKCHVLFEWPPIDLRYEIHINQIYYTLIW